MPMDNWPFGLMYEKAPSMKLGEEVLVKVKGVIEEAYHSQLCDLCLQWINEGDLFGSSGDKYDEGSCKATNCLSCLKKETP